MQDSPIALSVSKLTKKFGDFTAVDGVSFTVEDGRFFSILGPSGCGKTTLLRMIAGFTHPTEGQILINGRDMAEVEPNKRPVNLVFQHLALFPMMNIHENIAFGLRRRGESGKQLERKVEQMLERVGLPGFGKKKIDEISGGQKQRVAIARCLVLEPTVLLLDEPLGALDAKLREQMKVELKKLQADVGTTFVYITHDQSEAMVMSDTVAVMNAGHFEQVGPPAQLYHRPASSFVAQFVGSNNKLPVTARREQGTAFSAEYLDGKRYALAPSAEVRAEEPYDMFIRPEAILINPRGGELNTMQCEVKAILFDGGNSRLLVIPEGTSQELVVALPQNRQFDDVRANDRIAIGWDPSSAVCFKQADWKLYGEA